MFGTEAFTIYLLLHFCLISRLLFFAYSYIDSWFSYIFLCFELVDSVFGFVQTIFELQGRYLVLLFDISGFSFHWRRVPAATLEGRDFRARPESDREETIDRCSLWIRGGAKGVGLR